MTIIAHQHKSSRIRGGDLLVKPREDLQVTACRVDEAIRSGRTQALPIYQTIDPTTGLGRWPSQLLNLTSVRLRLSPLHADTVGKYEAKYEKPWDNRTTIKPCLLNGRFVSVNSRSPDYEQLLRATREERKAVQVVETTSGMRRRIYEVVEDVSHGLRQHIHVRSGYEKERQELLTARFKLQNRYRQAESGMLTWNDQELELANLTLAKAQMRLAEIDRITADRVVREESLRSYARQSNLHLFFLAQSLTNFKASITRTSFLDRRATATYLRGYIADLLLFTSGEVRPYRNYARNLLERIIDQIEEIDVGETSRLLQKVTQHLTQAALTLSRWAESISEDERLVANLRWVQAPEAASSL